MTPSSVVGRLAQNHRAQLDAICAAPDSDGPLQVLADMLSEAGDPLGEFITIQVTAGQRGAKGLARQREKVLLTTHGRSWAPRGLTDAVFIRGFARAGLLYGAADPRDPGWQLIDRLSVSPWQPAGQLLAQALPGLRSLQGAGVDELSGLGGGPPKPRLTALGSVNLRPLEVLGMIPPTLFPNLTSLACEETVQCDPAQLEALLQRAPAGLQRLRVPGANLALKPALALLARHRPTLALELSYGQCAIELWKAGVRRIDDSPEYSVECQISERLRALGLKEVEQERRGASQRQPLHYNSEIRIYPSVEPTPIIVRVSTQPPPPPEPPLQWGD